MDEQSQTQDSVQDIRTTSTGNIETNDQPKAQVQDAPDQSKLGPKQDEVKKRAKKLIEKERMKRQVLSIVVSFVLFFILFAVALAIAYQANKDASEVIYVPPEDQHSITPIPNTSDEEVDTSNWKVFTDEENGFSLSYPPHLQLTELENGLRIHHGDPTGLDWQNAISLSIRVTEESLAEYFENKPCEGERSTDERSRMLYESCIQIFEENRESYIIGGIEAIRSIWNPYENASIINIVEHGGKVFDIRHTTDEIPNGYSLANQILATFEFAEEGVQGITTTSCLESETEMLSEIGKCEVITETQCEELKLRYDGCISTCAQNLSREQCVNVCRPVCDYSGATL